MYEVNEKTNWPQAWYWVEELYWARHNTESEKYMDPSHDTWVEEQTWAKHYMELSKEGKTGCKVLYKGDVVILV